jgi:tetratricopeptide (TPR) repeat protein
MAIGRGPAPPRPAPALASGLPQATDGPILRSNEWNGAAMRNLLIVIATLLGLAAPAWADARSEFDAGNVFNNGDLDTAIADYTKAIELKPDLAEAYFNRGIEYEKLGQRDKAIAD